MTKTGAQAMTDRDDYYELIRLLARGDHAGYRQHCARLDEKGWDALGLVVGATFFRAVERHFDQGLDAGAVIQLVADARADLAGTGFDIPPDDGETLVMAVLTGNTEKADLIDANRVVEIELFLLRAMLKSSTDDEMAELFSEADGLAIRWAAGS
jgi:hypothetical protein